jgi:hypothetical protein
MALADRKSDTIHSETGSDKNALKAEYDAGKHETLINYPAEAALLYQIQLMKEDIDELRRYIVSSEILIAVTGSSLPTRATSRGLLWNDRGTVKIG